MDFQSLLKEHNLRATAPRLHILETLAQAQGPLAIDELQKRLGSKMDLSTLYRSLKKMADAGAVYQTDFRQGKAYFALQNNHQHYIVCTDCGDREEIQMCLHNETEQLEKQSKKFHSIKNHMLEFFGLCKKCQKG